MMLRGVTPPYINAYTCAHDLFIEGGGYLPRRKDYKV